ncbi:MAG: hypothetical protein AAGE03_14025 [Pseudomonadota bacterium]
MLRLIFAGLALLPAPAFADITFHFYGAENCPPCMAFKRDHLAGVQAIGNADGFMVHENVIRDLRDMPEIGIYGDSDPILRAALDVGGRPYPPVFFVSDGDTVLSVHGQDWQAALLAARDAE